MMAMAIERRFGFVVVLAVVAWGGSRAWTSRAGSPPQDEPVRRAGLYPRSPEESAGAVRALPGFAVELFAADPHLASPVAMTFDADGDVYVAEMLDYPIIRTPGMFGPFPEGQIRLLRTDGRGKVVKSTVFATAIAAPTSVVPYDGGVLVSAAPDILFLKDTDGDGHADVHTVVLTGFDTSQDLYRLNSLLWGIDGWIYARGVGDTPIHWGDDPNGPALSTAGMNFRFRPRERKFEPVSGLSSCFGLAMDDWGHLFFSNSANHAYQVVLADRYLKRNPYLVAPPLFREISDHGGVARVHRISEPQPWRVERSATWEKTGLTKKYFGKIEPRQDYMTAVCGPLVYRGAAFPDAYRGNYFVCEAVSNLVHRDVLTGPGPVLTASRGDRDREFLASADNWCSPVYLDAGPDGAMYVVDMYRQIIEHAGPDGGRDVPNVPLEVLQKYGLRTGSTMGRIYRIAPPGTIRGAKPRLGRASRGEVVEAPGEPGTWLHAASQRLMIVGALASRDAWWRTTAQRLILEKPAEADIEGIAALATKSPYAEVRVQALWTLDALGKLEPPMIEAALRDDSPGVRENALKMAEARFEKSSELTAAALAMTGEPDPTVRYQLALTLGEVPSAARTGALAALAAKGADDPYLRAAVLSSAADVPLDLYKRLAEGDDARGVDAFLREAAGVIGSRLDRQEIAGLLAAVARRPRASSLRGLAAGLKRRGKKGLDVPAAREPLALLKSSPSAEIREAASEVAALIRVLAPEQRAALAKDASAVALDESKPEADRIRAAESLGAIDAAGVVETLGALLHPRHPEPLQIAALRALDEQSGPQVVRLLGESWKAFTPGLRARAAEVALGRRDRLAPLLEAVKGGTIPADAFDPAQRARLLGSPDKAVAEAAKSVFGADSRKLDPKLFERYKPALDLAGDANRGAATFKKLCIACHKAGGEGAEVGPNLASVKNRPREQLLRDVLYPSMAFAPQYHQYVIATTDGKLITGLLTSSNAAGYTIRRQGGEDVTVLRKDVEELSDTRISLMPENLLEGLKPQDVADLLEFVGQAR